MAFDLADDGDTISITTSRKGAGIFLITVNDINDLLDPDNEGAAGWRYLILDTNWLESHRVQ
jgi:hypothetical protein